jgi:hypothetical protein
MLIFLVVNLLKYPVGSQNSHKPSYSGQYPGNKYNLRKLPISILSAPLYASRAAAVIVAPSTGTFLKRSISMAQRIAPLRYVYNRSK